jgi:CelD/BcsL family acetyltransferase involved in cellulose biosynthesis
MSITNIRNMLPRKYADEIHAMQVEIITEESDFLALEDIWNPLLQNSSTDNIFLTFEWLSTWWRHFAQGNQLFVMVVRNQE